MTVIIQNNRPRPRPYISRNEYITQYHGDIVNFVNLVLLERHVKSSCLPALSNPGPRHVRVLPAVDQVRRPSPVQLAQERQSRRRGTLSVCRRRLQPRIHLSRQSHVLIIVI